MTEEEVIHAIDDAIADWLQDAITWKDAIGQIRAVVNEYGSDEYERGLSDGTFNESRTSSSLGFFDHD